MTSLGQDLRYAARSLSRSPGFTLVAVATLALGIGANTAVFSIVRGVLLAPLPYTDAARVVVAGTSLPDFEDFRRETTSFESSAVFASNLYNVDMGGETKQRLGAVVTSNFFGVVGGVAPRAGRALGPSDANAPVAVLSESFARQLFPSDAAAKEALGEPLRLGGRPFTIVGVMPEEFEFPRRQFDFWVPLEYELARAPGQTENRSLRIFRLVARLKPEASLAAARAEVETLSKRLETQYPDTNKGFAFELVPLPERVVGAIRPALWTLFAAVGLVLLIASANVANLLLARGAARSRELAIRAALGAGRGRLIRQLLTESLTLSLAGAGLGALLGAWAVSALPLVAPDDLPRLSEIRLDPFVLLFTLAAGVGTGLVFGIAPAIQATRQSLSGAASDASRGSSTRQGRLRGGLVVAEVALAVVVLVGAGLLGRSLQRRLSVEKGFHPEGVTSFHINVFELADAEARARATAEVVKSLRSLPGVSSVGAGSALPPRTAQRGTQFDIEGRHVRRQGGSIRLLRGRHAGAVRDSADARRRGPGVLGHRPCGRAAGRDREPKPRPEALSRRDGPRPPPPRPQSRRQTGLARDRRHRPGRPLQRPRGPRRERDLHAVRPDAVHVGLCLRPVGSSRLRARSLDRRDRAPRPSRSRRRRRPSDGGARVGVGGGLPLPGGAALLLRGPRPAALGPRALRSRLLRRGPATARDRHPHRSRRGQPPDLPSRDGRRREARRLGARARIRRRAGGDPASREPALRGPTRRTP